MIRPLGKRLLVQAPEKPCESDGGIALVGTAAERMQDENVCTEVLAVGRDVGGIDVGDVVMLGRHCSAREDGTLRNLEGQDVLFVRESDVIALTA